jgi:hypothetical protein
MSHINQTTANESTSEDFRGSVSEKNDDTSDYISVPANSPANSGSHATNDADNEIIQQFTGKDVDLRKLHKDDYHYADNEDNLQQQQQQQQLSTEPFDVALRQLQQNIAAMECLKNQADTINTTDTTDTTCTETDTKTTDKSYLDKITQYCPTWTGCTNYTSNTTWTTVSSVVVIATLSITAGLLTYGKFKK